MHVLDQTRFPHFDVRADPLGTTQTVTIRGDVDCTVSDKLSAVIDRAIAGGPETLVIDLSATGFLDSTGVYCMLRAKRHTAARGVRLVMIPAPEPVQRIFSLCRLEDTLPFVGSPPARAA